MNKTDYQGDTALILSIKNKNDSITKALISAGANVNAPDNKGFTPLHWAIHDENTALAQALLHAGAQRDALNKMDETHLTALGIKKFQRDFSHDASESG